VSFLTRKAEALLELYCI